MKFLNCDFILSETDNKDSCPVSLLDDCAYHECLSDNWVQVSDGLYAMKCWVVSSFAWRNNDGIKPEYKGLIEVVLNNGNKPKAFVSELTWLRGFGSSVAKWRPVVLQSSDAKKEIQEKFLSALYADSQASKNVWNAIREQFCLPVGIDSPELREVFKSLKGHLESKPPFYNKSMQIFSCPCVAVNVEASKPSVSTKEDKPMRPVYTAEMHEKGERPQVGSEVALRYKFDSKQIHIIGKVLYASMEHCIIDGEHKECHYKMCDYTYEPIPKTIKVNGFDVPAPMSESPEDGAEYFIPSISNDDFVDNYHFHGDSYDKRWLSKGIAHSTKKSAIAHAKAMLGIDPNA